MSHLEKSPDRRSDIGSWKLIYRLYKDALRKHILLFVLSFSCMAVLAAMASAYTYLMGPLVDKVFIGGNATLLWLIGGGVAAIFVIRSAATYAQEVLLTYLGQKVVLETQNRLLDKIIYQDVAAFEATTAGSIVGNFTYDVNLLRATNFEFFLRVGKDTLTVCAMLGLMYATNWRMALICTIGIPLAILPISYLSKRLRGLSLDTQREIGHFTAKLTETFQSLAFVKTYGLEDVEARRAKVHALRLAQLMVHTTRTEAAILPVFDVLGGLATAYLIVYGGAEVISRAMTPGALLVFAGAVYNAYQPMRSMARVSVDLQTGLAAAQRIFYQIDQASGSVSRRQEKPISVIAGDIRFENVQFSYGSEDILRDISFFAPAGKVTALVGRIGAGKSTIIDLLLRFYDVSTGTITVDGRNIREIEPDTLRAGISVVPQEIVLFDDTVAANIRIGRPAATETEVLRAAHAVGALDFILDLPEGLMTRIGEKGVQLSSGQTQSIAVARALLRDAPILLLDEATRSQDSQTEHYVEIALRRHKRDRTTVVISHKLETVRNADLIHVLDAGVVRESGSHDELMARGGLYASLFSIRE
jgi:subfamily B ATP-binding cassette protein MsbA